MLGNGLRPHCTGALPGGPPWPARGTSSEFLLACRVHHGVGEAKTMVVVLLDGEIVPGGMRETGGPK